jgi:dipeptidyl aminopeptidase/acylaminoacyl peptidase
MIARFSNSDGLTGVLGLGFHPSAPAWVDRSLAFLSINYNGSLTFGREFGQSIWEDLGHWELEDMAALTSG